MKRKLRKTSLLPLALLLVLSACTLRPADETGVPVQPKVTADTATPAETETVIPEESETAGEENTTVVNETETAEVHPDPTSPYTSVTSGHWWWYEDGMYHYSFPERDESGRATYGEMYSVSQALFSDATDDWFWGSARYDSETGESEILWDRTQDVFDALAENHAIYRGDTSRKVVYFTFDCGYENGYTADILDTLKEKHVPATFFINGHYVDSAKDMIRRMLDEGHIVGNHTVNHEMLSTVSVGKFLEEVDGLDERYRAAFPDAPPMLYFRPPSGNCNEWVLKFAYKLGYTTVLYSFAYDDYHEDAQPDPEYAMELIQAKLHPGCVYLFHSMSATNAAIMGEAIDWIRSQGYEILPICDIVP